MPPLPKRKLSKGRSARRRSHLALAAMKLVSCPHCHKMRPAHRVCPECGYYKGEEIVEKKTKQAP